MGQRTPSGGQGGDNKAGATGRANGAFLTNQGTEAAFATVVFKVLALVPPIEACEVSSTWVERGTDEFDMKSAYGSGR